MTTPSCMVHGYYRAMRPWLLVVVLGSVAGCAKKPSPAPELPDPRFDGAMPVAFGDCAGGEVAWVSGPRPQPSEKQDADQTASGGFGTITGTGDITAGFDAYRYGGLLGIEEGELDRGFGYGRTGFGPSNGGPNWGALGTGRDGTIGHGTGTGSGYGVGSGRVGSGHSASSIPTVSIGQSSATGGLDQGMIRRYIKHNLLKITDCYEKALLTKPGTMGTVAVKFFIAPSGVVTSSSASGVAPSVSSCVAGVIKDIEFPKPKGGRGGQVNYPFTFRPSEDFQPQVVQASTPDAGSGSDVTAAVPAQPVPNADEPYQPGAANPLRPAAIELTECFRKHPKHFGVAVVELHYDATGNVTSALAHGIDDDRTSSCVSAAAKRVKRSEASVTTQRCSVAFGTMPATELPAIDITDSVMTFAGVQVGTPQAVVADETPTPMIAALVAAVSSNRKMLLAEHGPIVTVHGPVVIRPIASTSMKVVDSTLGSVIAGGDDPVLATRRGPEWQLVDPMALPVVPVPMGTGGHWNRIKSRSGAAAPAHDEERVVLSLYITNQQIWVGVSRVNEFQALERDATLSDKLAATLQEQKASAFFMDRTDLEIAAAGDVSYSDLVTVIDAATQAGFSDWRLTTPDGLAARPSY